MNFPFHPEVGSQTSVPMKESDVGFRVATTRQNAGKSWIDFAFGPELKSPAPTDFESVIRMVVEDSFASDSQA